MSPQPAQPAHVHAQAHTLQWMTYPRCPAVVQPPSLFSTAWHMAQCLPSRGLAITHRMMRCWALPPPHAQCDRMNAHPTPHTHAHITVLVPCAMYRHVCVRDIPRGAPSTRAMSLWSPPPLHCACAPLGCRASPLPSPLSPLPSLPGPVCALCVVSPSSTPLLLYGIHCMLLLRNTWCTPTR